LIRNATRNSEVAAGRPRRLELRSDLTAFHHGVDLLLRLRLVDAVFRHDLVDEVVPVLESAELLLGELVPSGSDVVEQDLLVLGRIGFSP
jgi:hypothetical protein